MSFPIALFAVALMLCVGLFVFNFAMRRLIETRLQQPDESAAPPRTAGHKSAELESASSDEQARESDKLGSANAKRLLTRESFEHVVAERVMEFRRDGGNLSALLLGIEDYDKVAVEAEAAGLPLMAAFAQLIVAAVGDSGIAARFSDREFAALLCNTDIESAIRLTDRLQRAINSCEVLNGPNARVSVGVSIGVTTAEADDFSCGMNCRLELALQEAVQAGGRSIYVHHEGNLVPAASVQSLEPVAPA